MTCTMPRINKRVLRRDCFESKKKVLQMLMSSFATKEMLVSQPFWTFFKGDEVLCLKLIWRWKLKEIGGVVMG